MTVDQDTATCYSGSIQDGNGAVGVVMAGSGTLVLVSGNTYSAGTTVSSGTLVATTARALPNDTALTVPVGATFIYDPDYTLAPPETDETFAPGNSGNRQLSPPPAGGAPTLLDPPPVVAAIRCAGPSLIDADTVQFIVLFNKLVTNVAASDFAVNGDGVTGTVASISGTGASYLITVGGITGSGALSLTVLDDGTITDQLGTPLDNAAVGPPSQYCTISRDLYWGGGSGVWNTACNFHVGGPTGPLQSWCDGSDVVLGGGPEVISISSPVEVGSITALSDGYVLEGSGAITLGSPQTTINVAVGSFTIDCGITGGALVKGGGGALVLDGFNSYSCCTTVSGGMLRLGNGALLPAGTALLVNGGILDLGGGTAALTTVTVAGSGSIVDGALAADTEIDLYSGTVLADIGGTAALDKLGPARPRSPAKTRIQAEPMPWRGLWWARMPDACRAR